MAAEPDRPTIGPVIGVGLNKTGTKTLRSLLERWGFDHTTYDAAAFQRYLADDVEPLLSEMGPGTSYEDWPWPLIYEAIDERFPDARFVLTTRRDPETWYRSLCKMAVRMGPLDDYELHVYGHAMPHGHQAEHIEFYERHNRQVRAHFAGRPGKLIEVCWGVDDRPAERLADFLGLPPLSNEIPHVNRSDRVYAGDDPRVAAVARRVVQTWARTHRFTRPIRRRLRPVRQRLRPRVHRPPAR